jgi:hypothetical protein
MKLTEQRHRIFPKKLHVASAVSFRNRRGWRLKSRREVRLFRSLVTVRFMPESIERWRNRQAEKIKCATWQYGQSKADVTDKIREAVREGRMRTATVDWLGDPCPGWGKLLTLEIHDGDRRQSIIILEYLPLPPFLFNRPVSESTYIPPPKKRFQVAYEQYRMHFKPNAKIAEIYAAVKMTAEGTGAKIPKLKTWERYVRDGKRFYEPPPADE